MQHQHRKKEPPKGFDLLEAEYAQKGLISGDAPHLIATKAVGDSNAHREEHTVHERKKRHRQHLAEFVARVKQKHAKMAKAMENAGGNAKKKAAKLPPQSKKDDINPDGRNRQ